MYARIRVSTVRYENVLVNDRKKCSRLKDSVYTSTVTSTKCVSDIFAGNELSAEMDTYVCRISTSTDQGATWFIISPRDST